MLTLIHWVRSSRPGNRTEDRRLRSVRAPSRFRQLLTTLSVIVSMVAVSLAATTGVAQAATTAYTGIAVTSGGLGYVGVTNTGAVYAFGNVVYHAPNPTGFTGTITGIAVTADGKGYVAVSSAGQVYAYGTVVYRANPTGFTGTIVGISVTADGKGYAAISSAGQVYTFGTAVYRANPSGFGGHIVGISLTADGKGYAAISSAGQVYTYGTAVYHTNPTGFTGTITGITLTADGHGYAAISSAGQVYAYGVTYRANPTGFTGTIAGISTTADGRGYAAISSTGQVYTYGTVGYHGNGTPPPQPPATLQDKVYSWASKILNGSNTPAVAGSTPWTSGRVPYSYAGGHGIIGPSLGVCGTGSGYTGSVPCGSGQFGDPRSTVGVDCSGFAHWVYSLATNSNVLDGGSDAQMTMFGGVRTSAPVAGDLVFWVGHHVGVYIGSDQMINANHTGTYVEIDSVSGNSGEGAPVFVHYAG